MWTCQGGLTSWSVRSDVCQQETVPGHLPAIPQWHFTKLCQKQPKLSDHLWNTSSEVLLTGTLVHVKQTQQIIGIVSKGIALETKQQRIKQQPHWQWLQAVEDLSPWHHQIWMCLHWVFSQSSHDWSSEHHLELWCFSCALISIWGHWIACGSQLGIICCNTTQQSKEIDRHDHMVTNQKASSLISKQTNLFDGTMQPRLFAVHEWKEQTTLSLFCSVFPIDEWLAWWPHVTNVVSSHASSFLPCAPCRNGTHSLNVDQLTTASSMLLGQIQQQGMSMIPTAIQCIVMPCVVTWLGSIPIWMFPLTMCQREDCQDCKRHNKPSNCLPTTKDPVLKCPQTMSDYPSSSMSTDRHKPMNQQLPPPMMMTRPAMLTNLKGTTNTTTTTNHNDLSEATKD